MYNILIKKPEEEDKAGQLLPGTYRIGKSPASHIQIDRPEVSARHAVLHVKDHGLILTDVGSTNGTFLNGTRCKKEKEYPVNAGDKIGIGSDVTIQVDDPNGKADQEEESEVTQKAEASSEVKAEANVEVKASSKAYQPVNLSSDKESFISISGIRYEYRKVAQDIKRSIHDELLKRINLKRLTLSDADRTEVRAQAQGTIQTILSEMKSEIPRGVDINVLELELVNEAVGLGALEALIEDDSVTEIMVNGCDHIYIEKNGNIYKTDLGFADNAQVVTVIERIVAPLGRRIDESQPLVDARLQDGSRVNAIIPPLAIDGPSLTIRKFSKKAFTVNDLISFGSMTTEIAKFLDICVKLRKNILISGGTGSGKTSLLNVVSNCLPHSDRIVTIEDAAELRLNQDHVVRLEARPPNIEGRGEITIRDLVRNSLRMRPDRIVIGECRGGEALDMLQAMNTGHDGSLTTIHANSPRDALARLETLVLMAGFDLPLRAIREQIAAAISIIVQIGRMKDGSRKVTKVTEITGMEGDIITSQDIFTFDQKGLGEDGRVIGQHKSCNIVPTFVEEIKISGISMDISIFNSGGDE